MRWMAAVAMIGCSGVATTERRALEEGADAGVVVVEMADASEPDALEVPDAMKAPDAPEPDAMEPSPSAWNGWHTFYCTNGTCGECLRYLPRYLVVDVLQLDGAGTGTLGLYHPACDTDRPQIVLPVEASAGNLSAEQDTCICHRSDASCEATLTGLAFDGSVAAMTITWAGGDCLERVTLVPAQPLLE